MNLNVGIRLKKVLIVMLVVALTYANFTIVGSYIIGGIASYAIDESEATVPVELAKAEQNIITNKVYGNKRIVQVEIKTGIEGTKYPMQNALIEIIPVLDNPTEITVESISNVNYTKGNWEYDEETNILAINLSNETDALDTKLAGLDVLVVTYVYDIDTMIEEYVEENNYNEAETIISTISTVEFELYNYDEKIELNEIQNAEIQNIELGNAIQISINSKDLYKVNMNKEETSYQEMLNINMNYKNLTDTIYISDTSNKFFAGEAENKTEIGTYYKSTQINKAQFLNVFGTDAVLTILDKNSNTGLAVINSETEADENGNTIIDYATDEIYEIEILIENNSTSVTEEIIEEDLENIESAETEKEEIQESEEELESKEAIETEQEKSEEKVENQICRASLLIINEKNIKTVENHENLTQMQINKAFIGNKETNTTIEIELNKDVNLKEQILTSSLGVDKSEMSTTQENDVTFTITLNTDERGYKLFSNPIFVIKLPSRIMSAEILKIQTVNAGAVLEIMESNIQTIDESQYIIIKTSGIQTEHTTANSNVQINIKTNLITEKLMGTENAQAVLYCSNEGAENLERMGETDVNFVAEEGIITASKLKYNTSEIMSLKNDYKVMGIGAGINQTVQLENVIINNMDSDLENVRILGNADNFTRIAIPSGKIYYTENANATTDENILENGWSNEYTADSKLYMIVLASFTMQEKYVYTFTMSIPENEDGDEFVSEYTVYNEELEQIAYSKATALTEAPKLEVELEATEKENGAIYKNSKVKYTISIKNNGAARAENVGIDLSLENVAKLNNDIELTNLSIEPGQTITKEILVQVSSVATRITLGAKITTNNLKEDIYKSIQENVIEKKLLFTVNDWIKTEYDQIEKYEPGAYFEYIVAINNISNETINNASIDIDLPEGLKLEKVIYDGKEINVTNNKIQGISMQKGELLNYNVIVKFVEFTSENIEVNINVLYNDVTLNYHKKYEIPMPLQIRATLTSNKLEQNLYPEEEIVYTLVVENIGDTSGYIDVRFNEIDDLAVKDVTYGEPQKVVYGITLIPKIYLGAKSNTKIILHANAQKLESNINITNFAIVSSENIEDYKTNTLVNKILKYDNPAIVNVPEESLKEEVELNTSKEIPETAEKHAISGIAWLDTNKNGQRDEEETLIPGVVAKLINIKTGEVMDTTVTSSLGKYQFTNLDDEEYVVEFGYNLKKYGTTNSTVEKVDETKNSDVIAVAEEKTVNTKTEIIEVKDNDAKNIDIGLVSNKIFDLEIDKFISKITVKNDAGTKEYKFNDSNMAKIEISGDNIAGTTVIVEYDIKVTNIGELPGYAKLISDMKPTGMDFKSELNTDWYEGKDGKLYCVAQNEKLNPEESKTMKLILIKELVTDEGQIIVNNANIEETFTEYIVSDKTESNNTSNATLVIGLETGKTEIVILIMAIDIIVIVLGCIIIKRKVIA